MLEEPIEKEGRLVVQKIRQLKSGRKPGGMGALGSQLNGARRDVVPENLETSASPRPHIVTGAAARHAHHAPRQARVRRQKIDQARRWFAFLPRHVLGLVTSFPIIPAHRTPLFLTAHQVLTRSDRLMLPTCSPLLFQERAG